MYIVEEESGDVCECRGYDFITEVEWEMNGTFLILT